MINILCDLGGKGGASSMPESGHEFLKGTPSVGVMDMAWRNSLGEGGFVNDRSRECVGLGGKGTSHESDESLKVQAETNLIRLCCKITEISLTVNCRHYIPLEFWLASGDPKNWRYWTLAIVGGIPVVEWAEPRPLATTNFLDLVTAVLNFV